MWCCFWTLTEGMLSQIHLCLRVKGQILFCRTHLSHLDIRESSGHMLESSGYTLVSWTPFGNLDTQYMRSIVHLLLNYLLACHTSNTGVLYNAHHDLPNSKTWFSRGKRWYPKGIKFQKWEKENDRWRGSHWLPCQMPEGVRTCYCIPFFTAKKLHGVVVALHLLGISCSWCMRV